VVKEQRFDFDYIIVGSGFGGSVCALRLAEKNYRVLILEKGKWFSSKDFPNRNWNLKKWMWLPILRFFGFFKLTFLKNITVLSGVGVGGGSLVYANALPVPDKKFFDAQSWAHLADWENELKPHYLRAKHMLGITPNPQLETGDQVLLRLAKDRDIEDKFRKTDVAVFFGEPGVEVDDPYFEGKGPRRSGCDFCGSCMIGCQKNAKNTLDKNYLHLAQQQGAQIRSESKVVDVKPLGPEDGSSGYAVTYKKSTSVFSSRITLKCQAIIFAAGVLGTVDLLLKLSQSSLPKISRMIGRRVRSNSESFFGITSFDQGTTFSDGVAIGSILSTDDCSNLEPVRYPSGSGFFRLFTSPLVYGNNILSRLGGIFVNFLKHPFQNMRVIFVFDWAKRTQILMFMQTIDSTLRLKRGLIGLRSNVEDGPAPTAFIPEARGLAEDYARIVNGKPSVMLTETLLGRPTTAHLLGGAVMGENKDCGVIDRNHAIHGYKNMYICDGSSISANPGVNPSLTITALAERAMSKIKPKTES
jgi:cholesterol oxidase